MQSRAYWGSSTIDSVSLSVPVDVIHDEGRRTVKLKMAINVDEISAASDVHPDIQVQHGFSEGGDEELTLIGDGTAEEPPAPVNGSQAVVSMEKPGAKQE